MFTCGRSLSIAYVRAPWGPEAPSGPEPWQDPNVGDSRTGPGSQGFSQPGARQPWGHRGSPSPRHLPGHGNRDSLRLCWDVHLQVGLAWQGPWLGRGHGEVETSPAAASVRQGMMVPRADMGSWNLGRVGGTLSV